MHVLRLTPHFYWPHLSGKGWPVRFDAIGGMQTQLYRLSQALSERQIDQTVLTLKLPDTDAEWRLSERVLVRGLRIPLLPMRSRIRGMVDLNASWALGCLAHVLRRQIGKVSVVHTHASGVIEPLLVGRIVSRLVDAPLVVSVHCSILSTYEPMHLGDRLMRPVALAVERSVLRSAAHTVFLTNKSRDKALSVGWIDSARCSIIPDSVDMEAFQERASERHRRQFLARFPHLQGKRLVTYVGRIAREKGWSRLIELLKRLPEPQIHLLVCGDGNERAEMERMIGRENLGDRVTITGYLSLDEVPAAMALSDVLVLVSNHEEFGGVMIEGMAVGSPSVAFSVGGVPAVQRDGVTGILVKPYDVDAMAERVRHVLADLNFRDRLSSAGRDHARQHFDVRSTAQRMVGVYEAAIQDHEATRARLHRHV